MVQKNDKIFELQNIIEKVKKDNMDYEVIIRKVKNETEQLERTLKSSRNELEDMKIKLNLAEKNQLSQKQIESALGEIMQAKHKLAYENGLLQSKVNQMGMDLKDYDNIKTDNDSLKRKNQDLSQHYDALLEDLQRLKSEFARKNIELQNCKTITVKHEDEMKMVVRAREEALMEIKRLSAHNKSSEEKLISKVREISFSYT